MQDAYSYKIYTVGTQLSVYHKNFEDVRDHYNIELMKFKVWPVVFGNTYFGI
jgi:hypothetical protein